MSDRKPVAEVVRYTVTPLDNGTFDVHEGPLLVGNFPTEEAANNAKKLTEERHK